MRVEGGIAGATAVGIDDPTSELAARQPSAMIGAETDLPFQGVARVSMLVPTADRGLRVGSMCA